MCWIYGAVVITQYNVLAEGRFFGTTGNRDNLGRLGINGPLYNLLSPYKGTHKVCSIYWVYNLYKCFIKLYQKSEVLLMHVRGGICSAGFYSGDCGVTLLYHFDRK